MRHFPVVLAQTDVPVVVSVLGLLEAQRIIISEDYVKYNIGYLRESMRRVAKKPIRLAGLHFGIQSALKPWSEVAFFTGNRIFFFRYLN